MRKSTLFLLGTTTAILSAYLLAKRTEKQADDFVWIDGDDPEDMSEPKPMFYVGDRVHIYNPHTGEFYAEDSDTIAPRKYEITSVKYDDEQGVFRYRLDYDTPSDWYSEDWLSLPVHTDFIRELVPKIKRDEPTPEMVEVERKILSQAMDDMARRTQIDKCLDTLAHGSVDERAEAERVLTELTKEEK